MNSFGNIVCKNQMEMTPGAKKTTGSGYEVILLKY